IRNDPVFLQRKGDLDRPHLPPGKRNAWIALLTFNRVPKLADKTSSSSPTSTRQSDRPTATATAIVITRARRSTGSRSRSRSRSRKRANPLLASGRSLHLKIQTSFGGHMRLVPPLPSQPTQEKKVDHDTHSQSP